MIGYVLLIILMVGAWTLACFGVKRDKDWQIIPGVIFGVTTTVLFTVSTIGIGTKHSVAVSFENGRNYQQELIYSISDTMSPQTISRIVANATYINEKIEKNRRRCDSKMWGFMYNKGVAEVEPIDIPKIKYQITIE